jgi:hypothetical protein
MIARTHAHTQSVPIHDEETGVYTTNATQDLFQLTINMQVEIAFRNLRGANFVSVMKICADVLRYFSDQLLLYLQVRACSLVSA